MTGKFLYPRSAFLGFDHLFNQLENIHNHANDHYPPHNVVKHTDTKYEVEMAVAGFTQDHIEIEVNDGVLTIKGNRPKRRENDLYVHKGISARKFEKSFRLSEYTEVTGADLSDGILAVTLEVVLPEEKRPRKIKINSNEGKNDNNSSELLTESA